MTTSNKTIIIMDNKTHHSEAEASAHHCLKDPDPKLNPEVEPAAHGPAGTAKSAGPSSLIDSVMSHFQSKVTISKISHTFKDKSRFQR